MTSTPATPPRPLAGQGLILLSVLAVAANLRGVIASVPPLTKEIASGLGLGSGWIGALTALPVLCMGAFAPLAHRAAIRSGAATPIAAGIAAISLGAALRGLGGHTSVYAGTFLAGVGIAIVGTLLPGLVKHLFPPERAGLVTGAYMLAMMGGAGVASAVSVPLAVALGSWSHSLALWALPAVAAFLLWLPLSRRIHQDAPSLDTDDTPADVRLPWRHPTAIIVTTFLALQSWQFYSSLAWLAPTYVDHGWSGERSGYLLSVFTATQMVAGFAGPALADRVRDRRLLLVPAAAAIAAGDLGVLVAPDAAPWLWATLLGVGQGASFAVGLVLLVSYASSTSASARLSAMGLGVSYVLAGFGPTVMGLVRDASGGFRSVWGGLALLVILQVAAVARLRPDLEPVGHG